jgi:hypothetical protein
MLFIRFFRRAGKLRMVFSGGTQDLFFVYDVQIWQVHATSLQQVQIQLIENIQARKQGLCDVCGNPKHHVPYLVRLNKIDNFVGISCQIQIEFLGGDVLTRWMGYVQRTTSRTTCGVKLDGFFGVDLFFPVKRTCFYRSDDFFTWRILRCASASPGGCSCGALPNAPPNSDLTKSASDRTLG